MSTRQQIDAMCQQLNIQVVMGAETHITLDTKTKLKCACANTDVDTPNTHICAVCTGQPGAMPHTNQEAIVKAIMLGKAIGSTIDPVFEMDRKHYDYPDLPA